MAEKPICSVVGCNKPIRARGWCSQHYQRWANHGDPLATTRYEGALCSLAGCSSKARARGLCLKHWRRVMLYGDPLLQFRASKGEPFDYFQSTVLTHQADECLIWPFDRSKAGYGRINLMDDGTRIVARLVCDHVHGPAPSPHHETAHSCGQGAAGCVAPRHVRWATSAENAADMIAHGNSRRGRKCNFAVLTEEDVRTIRALKGTMLQRDIAERFNVARPTITLILTGKTWAWLT